MADALTWDTVAIAAVSSAVFFIVWQALAVATVYLEQPEGLPSTIY